ncbi:MAG: hypothetical protein ACKVZ0_12480 [Gemmatimonadales bacterium]
MKIAAIVLAAVGLVVVFFWLTGPSPAQRAKTAEAAKSLRMAVLSRELFKSQPATAPTEVRAVVHDLGIGQGTATLVAFADGSTSLYLIPGGGFIGAGAHEAVKQAAARFREEAGRVSRSFAPLTDFPLLTGSQSAFYVVTDSATYGSGVVDTGDLLKGGQDLSELARLAQAVITQIRRSK